MKKVLLLVLGIFLFQSVMALEISSSVDTETLVLGVTNTINLNVSIKNADNGLYNIYTLSDIAMTPSEMFEIKNNSVEKTFALSATENLKNDGLYTFTFTINQRGVQKIDKKISLNIINLEDAIEVSSDNLNSSDNEVSFYVKNLKDVTLKGLKGKFTSTIFDTDKEFDLKPFEKKTFTLVVDSYKLKRMKAGVYAISSTFSTSLGKKEIMGTLFFGENKGISTLEEKSGLLVQKQKISKVNAGNVVEPVKIEITKNIISRLFTTFKTEPNLVERDGFFVKFTWTKERLSPAEVLTVEATSNYVLPFFVVIIVIIILVVLKRYSVSKILVKKSVVPVRTKNGEFALKITISVKAQRNVENVVVTDHIPRIVKLFTKFSGIQPTKIDPTSRTIQWRLGGLAGREERVLSYIVYSKVGVVGKFSLPSAKVVFEKDNMINQVDSNFVFFMNEQATTEN